MLVFKCLVLYNGTATTEGLVLYDDLERYAIVLCSYILNSEQGSKEVYKKKLMRKSFEWQSSSFCLLQLT